jgi:hypothetical protein
MSLSKPTEKKPAPLNLGAFPKTCGTCKKIYLTDIDFFQQTTPIPNLPTDIKVIKEDEHNEANVYLEAFRNCECGSTLMELFHCRRDISQMGIEKRAAFERILAALEKSGYDREAARLIILKFIELFVDGADKLGIARS